MTNILSEDILLQKLKGRFVQKNCGFIVEASEVKKKHKLKMRRVDGSYGPEIPVILGDIIVRRLSTGEEFIIRRGEFRKSFTEEKGHSSFMPYTGSL